MAKFKFIKKFKFKKRFQRRSQYLLRYLWIGCLVVSLVLASGVTPAQQPESPKLLVSPEPQLAVTRCVIPEREAFSFSQAQTFYEAGCYSAAAQVLETVRSQGDRLTQAIVSTNLSLTYQQLGRWNEAEVALAKALEQIEEAQFGDRAVIWAQTLDVQGQLQFARGQAADSANSWKQAAQLYVDLGQPERAALSQIKRSRALQALGLFRQVRDILLEVRQSLDNQPDSTVKATALRQLADALWTTGNTQIRLADRNRANLRSNRRASVQQTLTVQELFQRSQAIGERLGQPEIVTAVALSRGNFHRYQFFDEISQPKVNSTKAYRQLSQALMAYEQASLSNRQDTLALQARLNQFSLLLDRDLRIWLTDAKKLKASQRKALRTKIAPATLRSMYRSIVEQLDSLGPGRSAIDVQIHLAQSLSRLKPAQNVNAIQSARPGNVAPPDALSLEALEINDAEVLALLQEAEEQAKQLDDQRLLSYAWGQEGRFYELNGQNRAATVLTRQALSESQASNAQEISYQWQRQLGRLLNAQGDRKGAIAAYTHAFTALQALRTDLIAANTEQRFHFRDNVEPIYRELVALLLPPAGQGEANTIQVSQADLNLVRQVMDALQIAELENFFQAACVDTKTALGEALQPGDAGIYPIILGDRLEIVLQLPSEDGTDSYMLRRFSSPVDQQQIQQVVGQIQKLLDSSSVGAIGRLRKVSQRLYDALFLATEVGTVEIEASHPPQTLATALETAMPAVPNKTLVFVLDGPLRSIPLGVLYDGEDYLLDRYAIALNLGIEVRESEALPADRDLNVLAAGVKDPPSPFQNQKLRFVPQELDAILKSGASVKLLEDDDFTEITFNEELDDSHYQVVHLATHGTFSSNRDDTFILAHDRKIPVDQLSRLFRTTQAIQNPVELIIFSACRTAAGDERAVLGLAGATVQAGARSAIATLWSVDDAASVEFARSFYGYLEQPNTSRAVALQKAQLDLKASRNNKHRFWAPYVLVGSWR